jgi:Tetratricopeptide repeat
MGRNRGSLLHQTRILVFFSLALSLGPFAARVSAAPPTTEASKQAREAFAEGTSFFNLGQWDQAIAAWQKGYQFKPDPIFLYNIAQAYRLAENHEKAVFFYKSYVRNAPKAANRTEVEGRIEQLEKLIQQKHDARSSPPDAALPAVTPATTPSSEPAAQPPPQQPPPAATPATTPAAAEVVAAPPKRTDRRIDLGVAGGVNLWAVGIPGGAQPSTNITITAGYTLLFTQRIDLRLGVKLGYTYLADITSTDQFISVLIEPKLRIRLWQEKLFAFIDVGVGALIVSGVKSGSDLLTAGAASPGTVAAFELRPGVGIEYRVVPRFGIYLSPAMIYSPITNKKFTDSSMVRVDVSLGATLRL